MDTVSLIPAHEQQLGQSFIDTGRIIIDVEDKGALERIQAHIVDSAESALNCPMPDDAQTFLNTIHERVTVEKLNDFRLHVYRTMNEQSWLRPAYYALVSNAVHTLIGNELAMQNRVNLSIQLPQDDSSLLPIHSDVWSGDSPYEAVVWLPLVNCFERKSMYLAPPLANQALHDRLDEFADKTSDDLFYAIEKEAEFLKVDFGQIVVFNQALVHGNRINTVNETRWSMNCRFKGLTTPYADKKLGEFFSPITMRPMTHLGMAYKMHEGFPDD